MDKKDGSDALSLPRWESFPINGHEFGGDFPSGPYHRMISTLYGTGGESSQTINKSKLDNQYSSLVSAVGQPTNHIHKAGQSNSLKRSFPASVQRRQDSMASNLYSGLHRPEETRQEDSLHKPSLSGPQYSNGVKQVDKPSLVGASAQHKHLAEGVRTDSLPERSVTGDDLPTDTVPQLRMDKISTSIVSGEGQSKEIADKVKADEAPAGVIFMCNRMTRQSCFQYSLFGLPSSQSQLVKRIVPGTTLFLFVVDTRELHGIFEATSNGGFNLDPSAFRGAFPSQVRFRVCRDCKPLHERDFKKAIEDNYFASNKFKAELTSQQVSAILQLFCPGGFVVERIRMHENSLQNVSNTVGEWGGSALDTAECQSEKSMDISPQREKSLTVDRQENIYVGERGYMTNTRNENGPYSLDASKNTVWSSLYGCSGQNRGNNVHSTMLSEQAFKGGNIHLKNKHQDSLYASYMPSSSHLSNGGISGQVFSDKDIEKGRFYAYDRADDYDGYISKSRPWFEETESGHRGESNRIPQSNQDFFGIDDLVVSGQLRAEHFNRVRHMYEKEQLSRQDLEAYASHEPLHGQVEESNFHTHKRAVEDTVSNSSNAYPWKRPHYSNDSYEDIMLKEQNRSSSWAPFNVDWMRHASQPVNRLDESNPSQVFSNANHVSSPQELERGLVSQPAQPGRPHFTGAIGGSTFANHY